MKETQTEDQQQNQMTGDRNTVAIKKLVLKSILWQKICMHL